MSRTRGEFRVAKLVKYEHVACELGNNREVEETDHARHSFSKKLLDAETKPTRANRDIRSNRPWV